MQFHIWAQSKTHQYTEESFDDVLAMVNLWGIPTYFLIMPYIADLKSKELPYIKKLSNQEERNLLKSNPVLVATNFA